MKPIFDKNGLATDPGDMRCFYYSPSTGEYTGWSDEYINIGVSMPGNSTDIDPGSDIPGHAWVFINDRWNSQEDHRGEFVYSTSNAEKIVVDYIGTIRTGFTSMPPLTPYDKWTGTAWVTDDTAQHAAVVAEADAKKAALLTEANAITADWRTELALGIISDGDRAKLIEWMEYIKAVKAVDTSTVPNVTWPLKPEV
ncbi:tail fiber assembly protein [Edwardsiella tarda]|uniref:tail fiber assembly protein n=1 Tax=Edwardsiella tarda TaxID=636 RepID=UPI00351C46CE